MREDLTGSQQGEQGKERLFDREKCIEYTVRDFQTYIIPVGYLPQHQPIETRYLSGEISWENRFLRIRSVDTYINEKKDQLLTHPQKITAEELQEFIDKGKESKKSFGFDIVNEANNHGLVQSMTIEEIEELIDLSYKHIYSLRKYLRDSTENEFNEFSKGWAIFFSKDKNQPYLLIPEKSEEGEISFQVVNLDLLNAKNPQFLSQLIIEYHQKSALRSLAETINYNLRIHEVSPDDSLPDFLIKVAQITDSEEIRKVTESLKGFLEWLMMFKDFPQLIWYRNDSLRGRKIPLVGGLKASIKSYLNHMKNCPGTQEERDRFSIMMDLLDKILSVTSRNYDYSSSKLVQELAQRGITPKNEILLEPNAYTLYVRERENNIRQNQARSRGFRDFVAKTKDLEIDDFLRVLEEDLPDFYKKLIEFKKWLGSDIFGESNFDRLISLITRQAVFFGDELSFEDLLQYCQEGLKTLYLPQAQNQPFEGVSVSNSYTNIYDPYLKAVLPLYIIKQLQADAREKSSDVFLRDYYERKSAQYQSLIKEMIKFYERDVEEYDRSLEQLELEKRSLSEFKEQVGITDSELDEIRKLSKREFKKKDDKEKEFMDFDEFDTLFYDCLFHALVLKKQGVISTGPELVALLKELFPNKPDEIWQRLNELLS